MSRWFICASVAAFLSLPAQPANAQPTLHGPVAGYVYNHASRSVRPLIGIPGSTSIGAAVLNEVDWASIAPDGKWAWITKDGHSSLLRGLNDPVPVSVEGLIDAIDRVAWSPDGSLAVLYSSAGNQLQRVRLSDAEIRADAPVDLSPWGQVATMAVDAAGQRIAVGITGSGIYLLEGGQSPALLSPTPQPAAATFDDTGRRLYAIDLDQQRILEFVDGSGASEFASLAQPDGPAPNPVGMAVSGGGRYLLLADSAAHAVRVYDIASRVLVNTIPLDFAPSRLEALSAGSTFLLNGDNSNEWLLVLDARQIPGVYFVPASQEEPR